MSLNPGLRPDRKFLASSAPNWPIRTEGLPLGLYCGALGGEHFQVDALVGRLLGSQRGAHGDQSPRGNMFRRPVDGIRGAEPAVAKVEDREFSVLGLSSD